MGFFDKFKNSKSGDSNEASSTKAAAPTKKKSNDLAKALTESVWEEVHEKFKGNKRFFIKNDNDEREYVGLYFDTNDVGGLAGRDARNDESKGSIIEAIKNGSIMTFMTMEMFEDNGLIIIPTKETIDNMEEFYILAKISYTLCRISSDGVVRTIVDAEDNEVKVTYQQIKEFINSTDDIKTLLPNAPRKDDFGEQPVEAPPVPIEDQDIEDIDDIEDYHETPEEYDAVNNNINFEEPKNVTKEKEKEKKKSKKSKRKPKVEKESEPKPEEESEPQNNSNDGSLDINDINDYNGMDFYNGEDEYEDVDEETVRNAAKRLFYSDDLGLEVSTQPFDVYFMHGNSYLPFNENRGPGLLNEHLSNISKDGNLRMERLHMQNLYELRNKYMDLIQAACESISKSLDTQTTQTEFGRIKEMMKQTRDAAIRDLDSSTQKEIDALNNRWADILEDVGEQAKKNAIREYEEEHLRTHEMDIERLKSYAKDEIERDYENDVKRLNEDRRAEASKVLDITINQVLKDLSAEYLKTLEKEKVEYIRIQNQISAYIEKNKSDEAERISVLRKENQQNNKAEEVRREYAGKMRSMAAEFEAKTSSLQADLNKMRVDHENDIRIKVASWNDRIAEEKEKTDLVQKQLDDLLVKYAALENSKKEEYADRIVQLEHERDGYKDELDHVMDVHKRSGKITVFLTIAAVIAFLGIGFMIGSLVNIRRASVMEQEAISKVAQSVEDKTETGDTANTASIVSSTADDIINTVSSN